MSLHVKRQMIGPTKRPLTQVTTERFLAGVFPIMPGQLVRPGKLPSASLPGTLIRFLTCIEYFPISNKTQYENIIKNYTKSHYLVYLCKQKPLFSFLKRVENRRTKNCT